MKKASKKDIKKSIKLNKKNLLIIGGASLVLIAIVAIIIGIFVSGESKKNTERKVKRYSDYVMNARIRVMDFNDETEEYSITLNEDGTNATIKTSYIDNEIYYTPDGLYYSEGGRFKRVQRDYAYVDTYGLIKELHLGEPVYDEDGEKSYNPTISKTVVNKIIDSLLIGKRSSSDNTTAYVTYVDDQLKEFSILVEDIKDTKSVSILIAFSYSKNGVFVENPNIYKKLVDNVDSKKLLILQ